MNSKIILFFGIFLIAAMSVESRPNDMDDLKERLTIELSKTAARELIQTGNIYQLKRECNQLESQNYPGMNDQERRVGQIICEEINKN